MLHLIKNSIKKEYVHIRKGISSISGDIIGGVGAILSLFTFISAMICFAVLIVKFVSAGGYENVFSNVLSIRGNAGSFYDMPYLAILGGFNIALLLVSYILFFKNEKWGLRILGLVPFIVVLACFIAYSAMTHMYKQGKIESTNETRLIAYGLIIAGFVAVIISVIILQIREKVMSRSCLRMLILSFGILPLLTLCIENIFILILFVVVFILLIFFIRDDVSGGNDNNYKIPERTIAEPSKISSGLTREQQQAIYDINRRYKEGCAAIVKANNDNGAWVNSEKTNREISKLRNELEKEAALRGVKGKVSIY